MTSSLQDKMNAHINALKSLPTIDEDLDDSVRQPLLAAHAQALTNAVDNIADEFISELLTADQIEQEITVKLLSAISAKLLPLLQQARQDTTDGPNHQRQDPTDSREQPHN